MRRRLFPTIVAIAIMLSESVILAGCAHLLSDDDQITHEIVNVTDDQPMDDTSSVSHFPRLCEDGSSPVFEGEVQDDFGLSIAVCLRETSQNAPAVVLIHYSGEGGTQSVSCASGQCQGIIQLQRYTRYRFTVLTLKWRDENGVQTLMESYDAQEPNGRAKVSVTHSWRPRGSIEPIGEEPTFPVISRSAPLQLLKLESHLLEDVGRR